MINHIDTIIQGCESFKIGKTRMVPFEKRKEEPDYVEYDNIYDVFHSSDKDLVSRMEKELIDYYKNNEKCDNEKDGEQSYNDQMAEGSQQYTVYVVTKSKNNILTSKNK